MTLVQVKAILGITSSDYDIRISALLPGLEMFVREYCHNNFLKSKPATTSTAIFFDADTKTISCSDFEDYRANYQVMVEDSLYNNGFYTIASLDTGEIVTVEDLVDEAVGEEITISESVLPKQVEIAIAKMINFQLKSVEGLQQRKLGDGSETYLTSFPNHLLDLLPRSVSSV